MSNIHLYKEAHPIKVTFKNLNVGEIFDFENTTYIKINNGCIAPNVLNMDEVDSSGNCFIGNFSGLEECIPLDVSIIIKR